MQFNYIFTNTIKHFLIELSKHSKTIRKQIKFFCVVCIHQEFSSFLSYITTRTTLNIFCTHRDVLLNIIIRLKHYKKTYLTCKILDKNHRSMLKATIEYF